MIFIVAFKRNPCTVWGGFDLGYASHVENFQLLEYFEILEYTEVANYLFKILLVIMSSLFRRFLSFLISCCGRVVDLCSKVGRCCLVWVHLVISYYPILSFIWVLMIGRLIIINIVDVGHKVVSRVVRGELRRSGQILTKKSSAVYKTPKKQIKQTNETSK